MGKLMLLWAALACFAGVAPSLGYGTGGGSLAKNLVDLEDFINKIFKEKYAVEDLLEEAVSMQGDLTTGMQNMQDVTWPALGDTASQQNQCLEEIRRKLQTLLGGLGPLETSLAGQTAITTANEATVSTLSERVDLLRSANNRQSASLVRLASALDEAKEKVEEKGQALADQTQDRVDRLGQNILSADQQLQDRTCIQDMATVEVDGESGEGSADVTYSPMGVLGGSAPSALCLLKSFESQLDLPGKSRGHTYGIYEPEAEDHRRTVALTVDCQPLTDKVKVMAFDQSEGGDNSMTKASVAVKACTPRQLF